MSLENPAPIGNVPGFALPKTMDNPDETGWIYKWTNYVTGYQKRWFVLHNGVLSYYRSPQDVRRACRGTISMRSAVVTRTTDHSGLTFIISGGNTIMYLRAVNAEDREKWMNSLAASKKQYTASESDDDEDKPSLESEVNSIVKKLNETMAAMEKKKELVYHLRESCSKRLSETTFPDADKARVFQERFENLMGAVDELHRCGEHLLMTGNTLNSKIERFVAEEQAQKKLLEDTIHHLGKQHFTLEVAARESQETQDSDARSRIQALSDHTTTASDDEDFFDAPCDVSSMTLSYQNLSQMVPSTLSLPSPESSIPASSSSNSTSYYSAGSTPRSKSETDGDEGKTVVRRVRRTRVTNRPDHSMSLWSIMRSCIGKELSKIAMPVNFSEPLSMLQRLTEDFQYSHLLDKAAQQTDSCKQLAYVAAFTVSSYSTTAVRTNKPFNPLLGETYECDRTDDMGWRAHSEQVSHHPPVAAQHVEGRGWIAYQEFSMASSFKGKYLLVMPLGISHLIFTDSGNHYTWRKVKTTVHNIIFGTLWIDQSGEMDITNHVNGDVCHLEYAPYPFMGRGPEKQVTGYVKTVTNEKKWNIIGRWDSHVTVSPVEQGPRSKTAAATAKETIWTAEPNDPESVNYYNFSRFACSLNEPEDGVAPTDSRNRPDQRHMEEGQWDDANKEKLRLEAKQRAKAHAHKSSDDPEQGPRWFHLQVDETTQGRIHVSNNEYFKCKEAHDWSRCPDIY